MDGFGGDCFVLIRKPFYSCSLPPRRYRFSVQIDVFVFVKV